jgi:hypothetical protein
MAVVEMVSGAIRNAEAAPGPCPRGGVTTCSARHRWCCELRVEARALWGGRPGGRQGWAESRWTPGRDANRVVAARPDARRPGATSARGGVGAAQPGGSTERCPPPPAERRSGRNAAAWRAPAPSLTIEELLMTCCARRRPIVRPSESAQFASRARRDERAGSLPVTEEQRSHARQIAISRPRVTVGALAAFGEIAPTPSGCVGNQMVARAPRIFSERC